MALMIRNSTVCAGAVYQISVRFMFGSPARSGEVSNQSERGSLPLSSPLDNPPTLIFELHYAPDGTPVVETATIQPLPSGSCLPAGLSHSTSQTDHQSEPALAGAGGKEVP